MSDELLEDIEYMESCLHPSLFMGLTNRLNSNNIYFEIDELRLYSDKPTYGFVYVLYDGYAHKIGFTVNPNSRIKQLQTANSQNLKILDIVAVDNYTGAENWLKNMFEDYHVRGEWYVLPHEDLVYWLLLKFALWRQIELLNTGTRRFVWHWLSK